MNLKAYEAAKEKYPNMMLLFRRRDGYEMYSDDTMIGAKLLHLPFANRVIDGQTIPVTFLPHPLFERHLHTLLRAGNRVAICDIPDDAPEPKQQHTLFDMEAA